MIDETSSLQDVSYEVAAALNARGIVGVLTGGSAAAIYAPQKYVSDDNDFVLVDDTSLQEVAAALEPLGFRREGRSRIFAHPKSRFTIDFPRGPLAVGGDYVREIAVLERDGLHLRALTRTDCIRDRLSHFYHWEDYTALDAAVAVAKSALDEVDFEGIRAWTAAEDPSLIMKFVEFQRRVNTGGSA